MLWKAVVVAPDEPHASSPNRAEVPAVVSATVVERSITGSPLYASRARASIRSSCVYAVGILAPHSCLSRLFQPVSPLHPVGDHFYAPLLSAGFRRAALASQPS